MKSTTNSNANGPHHSPQETVAPAVTAVKDRVRQIEAQVSLKTDDAMSAVGDRMTGIADSMRHTTPKVTQSVERTAAGIDKAGTYLKQSHPKDVLTDMGAVLTRHPLATVGVALGVGLLIGRKLRS